MVGLHPREISGNYKSEQFNPDKVLRAGQNECPWLGNLPRLKNIIGQVLVKGINLKPLTISLIPRFLCISTNLFSLRQCNTILLFILNSLIVWFQFIVYSKYSYTRSISLSFTSFCSIDHATVNFSDEG